MMGDWEVERMGKKCRARLLEATMTCQSEGHEGRFPLLGEGVLDSSPGRGGSDSHFSPLHVCVAFRRARWWHVDLTGLCLSATEDPTAPGVAGYGGFLGRAYPPLTDTLYHNTFQGPKPPWLLPSGNLPLLPIVSFSVYMCPLLACPRPFPCIPRRNPSDPCVRDGVRGGHARGGKTG